MREVEAGVIVGFAKVSRERACHPDGMGPDTAGMVRF
jgi:hypothetical protein